MAIKPPSEPEPQPERADTDTSLRTERHATDLAVEKIRDVERDADQVMDLARDRADTVLADAREKADQDPHGSGLSDAKATDRAHADEVLQAERTDEDKNLRREREDIAQTLLALLPLERESTDRNLLTERTRSDTALSNRDDFLGMVSHDLNNLLAGIVMSASILSSKASETEEGQRIITGTKRIQLYAARMKKLIGDLVDVTSIAAGRLAVTTAPSDSRAVVLEALETFRLPASEKGILLDFQIADQPLMAVFDHDRILQVLANLMANAIKFTPHGGKLFTRAEHVSSELRFSVSDTGPGIRENLLEAVFERFWQAGENDRRGLGLGLYIARSIVQAHGGRIWAESRIGKGSTFHFTLPVASDSAHQAGVSTPR